MRLVAPRRVAALLVVAALTLGACGILPTDDVSSACADLAEADCATLMETALPVISGFRLGKPTAVAVGSTCPPGADCVPSALGGDTIGVVAIWPDGELAWATIELPLDWPNARAGAPGSPVVESGEPPQHLTEMIR